MLSRSVGRAVILVTLVVVAVALASCSSASKAATGTTPAVTQYPPRVALFGDSLSWEAEPYFTSLVDATGETALIHDSFGGTAICDWFSRMREVEAQNHPKGVVLQFSGNALTPCMEGYVPYTASYLEKYRIDTEKALDIFVPGGAHVFLVGAPITREQQESVPGWDALNRQYAEIAAADPDHVTYVDAGSSVEGPGRTYVVTLPCLVDEPCTGPVVGGVPSNTVRSPDGVHFCPSQTGDEEGVIGGCGVYSSGAYRFAAAIVQSLARPV